MVIHPQDVPNERQPERSLFLKRLIRGDIHSPNLSVTWVRINGHHDRIVNHVCDRVYYVLEGAGQFQLEDGPLEHVEAGDAVFIPRGTPYEFGGEMTYLVINAPAFVPDSDRVLPSVF
jgi:mannose-6-phosphate isomerase-like protein (cupin superfamily)